MNVASMRLPLIVIIACGVSSCDGLLGCPVQYRQFELYAKLTAASTHGIELNATGEARFIGSEWRNSAQLPAASWNVRVTAVDSSFETVAHFHRGSVGVDGPVLFTFTHSGAEVIPLTWQTNSERVTDLSFTELLQLARSDNLYIDVHGPGAQPIARGQVSIVSEGRFRDSCQN